MDGIRGAMIEGDGLTDIAPTLAGLLLSGLVLIPAGVYVFSVVERYAKRTGRLKRNG